MILDLFESFCGARLTTNIMEIGGFTRDIPDGWIEKCREFLRDLPGAPAGVCRPPLGQPDLARTAPRGSASSSPEDAHRLLADRADDSRLGRRLRHPQGDARTSSTTASIWRCRSARTATPTTAIWSAWRRCASRCAMIEQCLDQMPTDGPLLARESNYVHAAAPGARSTTPRICSATSSGDQGLTPPKGEVYVAIEDPKGEIGYYIVSDGTPLPYRLHIRAPHDSSTCKSCPRWPRRDAGRHGGADRDDRHRAGGRDGTGEASQ